MNVAAINLLQWIGQAVVLGTLLTALTWALLRLLGRRISPAMQAVFWLIVLVKFVVPGGPGWSYSLATSLNSATGIYSRLLGSTPRAPTSLETITLTTLADADRAPAVVAPPTPISQRSRAATSTILAISYLAIGALFATARVMFYHRFVRRAGRYLVAADPVRDRVSAACRTLGVRRVPDVRISPDAPAPFVFGLLRSVLVLSPRQLVRPDELDAVILHEVAHLRRGDLIVRCLQWLAGTLLFFWPVVAWVNRRIDLARETACDEWALRHGRLSAGAYARCLLDAIQPIRASRWAYRPAAMAANLSTVERRIEMILSSPVRTRRLAAGVPLAIVALAWAGFALTGVARGEDPKPQSSDQPQPIVVEAEADANGPIGIKIIKGDQGDFSPENLKVHMLKMGVPTEAALAEFLAAHPTADADGDGKLSHTERNAYLTALVMHDPAAVLQKYPTADKDGDGQLSAEEAAQLVTGGMFLKRIEGPRGSDGTKACQEHMFIARYDRRTNKDAAALVRPTNPNETATWLLENVPYVPVTTEVAQYVEAVESAPFADLLKRHPEADLDGDGKLSAAEREAFLKMDHDRVAAMLLKHFPEADTNGDGVLSQEEIRAIKGKHMILKQNESSDGTQGESVRVNGTEPGDHIVILKTEETTEKSDE